MALLLLFHLFSAAIYTAAAVQQRSTNITLGSFLTPTGNSSWLSPNGHFAFGFYRQGSGFAVGIFLAGLPERTPVWTANRDTNPVFPSNSTLMLKSDGRLVVEVGQGQDIEIIHHGFPITLASMLDNGNFVVYSSDGIMWQSFDNPTNTLLPGQSLLNGKELVSSASESDDSTGKFRIKMQSDGNLVQYPVQTSDTGENAYWASGTFGDGNQITLNLEEDGYLYLVNSTINIVHNITNGGYPKEKTIYIAKLDVDGIFRLYSYPFGHGDWSVLWSTTDDKCTPKGVCGMNAFCTIMDIEAECKCLPGFNIVSPGNWSSGCNRNFTARSCQETAGGDIGYEMSVLDSTVWQRNSYEVFRTSTKEDCGQACLKDCNCDAAQFKDGDCSKERLPLIYGRRSVDDSNAALIKVGLPANIKGGQQNPVVAPDPVDHPTKRKKQLRIDIFVVGILLLAFALLVLAISGMLIHKSRVLRYTIISVSRDGHFWDDVRPRAFSYVELQQATNDFKEELGRGAFGRVFKGVLAENQKLVAVKSLEKVLEEGETEFQNEMKVIGKTHHRNLVKLLGYCIDGPKRLLVYEYMSNGSLADILFTTDPEKQPCWEERIGIAQDIARGLLYLHEECDTQIIHCDIKSQNILMGDRCLAKISDFGLAKLMRQDQTRTYTGIRGTRGYVAPEWFRKMAVTVKADVYSFGIVLLELITRRKSVDSSLSEEEAVLEEWVYNCFEAGEVGKVVGDEEVDKTQLERVIKISIWCIQDEPSIRPSIKQVLLMLEGIVDIPAPPNPTSFLSVV